MEKRNHLSDNLKAYQKARSLSMAEFSEELGIPKSTMQSIMAEGNATMDTVLRLSERLGVPLDKLVHDEHLSENLGLAQWLLRGLEWYTALPQEKQTAVAFHVNELLKAVAE